MGTPIKTPQTLAQRESNEQTPKETQPASRNDLWKDALEIKKDSAIIQLVGLGSAEHTVYGRVTSDSPADAKIPIGAVIEQLVDQGWKNVAKDILEKKEHVQVDSYPPVNTLLELGAVWLLNETMYVSSKSHDAHAHRLAAKDYDRVPNWADMTLRVHYAPDRFFVCEDYDWGKYCKGLLLDGSIQVSVGEAKPHVNFTEGLPDRKDGAIIYEDLDLGFAILNKPGNMPVHATLSNHAEDVVSAYGKALRASQHAKGKLIHVSVSQRYVGGLETELHGLLPVATHSNFATYHSKFLLDQKKMTRTFKCLICVKNPDSMELLEQYLSSSTVVHHYVDVKSPVPKRFVAKVPKDAKNQKKDWQSCQIRILQIGDESFRAACVRSVYKDSIDTCLAQRLWGADSDTPAEDLGVQYVMELQLEIVGTAHKHQIRGQLAALGFPIVGDTTYGGGKCEFHSNKHAWNRMALQCNTVSFPEPKWKDEEDHKKGLIPSERQCVASIHKAWWSEYLTQYELYHQSF